MQSKVNHYFGKHGLCKCCGADKELVSAGIEQTVCPQTNKVVSIEYARTVKKWDDILKKFRKKY